jgi:mRNA-degrading endonuclease toxin of MazEF toxin-antitoxin module
MMKFIQFEIWTAELIPQIGTEPGKIRPVVVQTDLLNKGAPFGDYLFRTQSGV